MNENDKKTIVITDTEIITEKKSWWIWFFDKSKIELYKLLWKDIHIIQLKKISEEEEKYMKESLQQIHTSFQQIKEILLSCKSITDLKRNFTILQQRRENIQEITKETLNELALSSNNYNRIKEYLKDKIHFEWIRTSYTKSHRDWQFLDKEKIKQDFIEKGCWVLDNRGWIWKDFYTVNNVGVEWDIFDNEWNINTIQFHDRKDCSWCYNDIRYRSWHHYIEITYDALEKYWANIDKIIQEFIKKKLESLEMIENYLSGFIKYTSE